VDCCSRNRRGRRGESSCRSSRLSRSSARRCNSCSSSPVSIPTHCHACRRDRTRWRSSFPQAGSGCLNSMNTSQRIRGASHPRQNSSGTDCPHGLHIPIRPRRAADNAGRFCGQPRNICLRIVPVDFDHRPVTFAPTIVAARAVRPCRAAPPIGHACIPFRPGHLVTPYGKVGADCHRPLRAFIFRTVCFGGRRAHRETARRDHDHRWAPSAV